MSPCASRAAATTPVLFIGGAHAREWVPPDALLTLLAAPARRLRGRDRPRDPGVHRHRRRRPTSSMPRPRSRPPTSSGSSRASSCTSSRCINPDGRAFSQSSPAQRDVAQEPPPAAAGLARAAASTATATYDIAWDYERYYSPLGRRRELRVERTRATPGLHRAGGCVRAGGPQRRGRSCASSDIAYFVDVHSFSRKLLYPWGMDGNQTRDPSQNYRNPAWDGRRDGTTGGPYGEYIAAGGARAPRARRRRRCTTRSSTAPAATGGRVCARSTPSSPGSRCIRRPARARTSPSASARTAR